MPMRAARRRALLHLGGRDRRRKRGHGDRPLAERFVGDGGEKGAIDAAGKGDQRRAHLDQKASQPGLFLVVGGWR